MSARDVAASLRAVAALRALCVRLPHLPTPFERERLARFEALVASPGSAAPEDIEAVVAGWRAWWRVGRTAELLAMAGDLPEGFVARDRHLATYLAAAHEHLTTRPRH